MRIINKTMRPDELAAGGDYLFNPLSKAWEPVQEAYWSDDIQRYYVLIGPLKGYGSIQTYAQGARVTAQRYYY